MKRPVLVFDYGNVVAFFDYARACAPFADRLGLTPEALLDRIKRGGLDALTLEHESGRMSGQEFARGVCAAGELGDVTYSTFCDAWRDIFWLNEPVVRLIADLKARNYTLILGSNTNALHAEDFLIRFAPAFEPFDRIVLSYQVGHMKPRREFYEACADAAVVPTSECVFIDDMPENAAGASEAGMTGLIYRDFATLLDELRTLGVET